MANMADAMLRNLQRFVEAELHGLVPWEQCRTMVPSVDEGNAAEAHFKVNGKSFNVRVESSEKAPPLGRITLNGAMVGNIDYTVWKEVARQIKEAFRGGQGNQGAAA